MCSGGWACAGAGYSAPTKGYQTAGSAGWADKYYYYNQVPSGHNCTRYAAYRLYKNGLSDPGRSWGMAYQWDANAPGVHNTTATVGSIAWWNKGSAYGPSAGHVAYVEEVGKDPANGKTYIVVTQDNAGGVTEKVRIVQGSAYYPNKFLHIKDTASTPPQPSYPVGVVMATTQRQQAATLNSKLLGWYAVGTRLSLVCYARGQSVKGYYSKYVGGGGWDNLWYKTTDGGFAADIDINTGSNNPVTGAC
nr:CHAP domain-containing protein [Mycolicibacterium sp. BK634]